ncbi:hypothetical protein ABZ502_17695 [Streptomyces abikoensis]|uniref:hypothetical protein n=1 Tax=Streptomyces abikoensis TaxID=97398 RepID=UPI0033CE5C06
MPLEKRLDDALEHQLDAIEPQVKAVDDGNGDQEGEAGEGSAGRRRHKSRNTWEHSKRTPENEDGDDDPDRYPSGYQDGYRAGYRESSRKRTSQDSDETDWAAKITSLPARLQQSRHLQWGQFFSFAGRVAVSWWVPPYLTPTFIGWLRDVQNYSETDSWAPIIIGVGLIAIGLVIARRTAHWWPPLAWCGRIPVTAATLAIFLYA